jgi:very-short-patch-repair endonuclease
MRGQSNQFSKSAASGLRQSLTDAEQVLWQRLRGSQLGVKFRRQHPFDGYVLDFVCLSERLLIEVDGSQHADAIDYDTQRTAHLEAAGFRVLRFWNNDVLNQTGAVMEVIWSALNPSPPQPSP